MCRKEYDIEEIGLGNFSPLITGKIQAIGKKKKAYCIKTFLNV
jgi:hypothetical protein